MRYFKFFLSAIALMACGSQVNASSYGVYDSRGLGMAGTAVAVGNINQGQFYNPSLIAFHEGDEDRTQDGIHTFSAIVNRLSDGAQTAIEVITDDLEGRLSRAIDELNDVPTANAARNGIDAARDLGKAMRKINREGIDADGYIGYALTLPGDREGGAFFIGARLLGAGTSTIDGSDLELLDDYIEALQYVASSGEQGSQHPELYNEENRLYDPSSRILSSAAGTGIVLSELGVSAAKQWQIGGIPLAVGFTPKLVQLRSYDERWRVVEGSFASNDSVRRALYFNFDVGVTAEIANQYRVALAIKDARRYSFSTALGREVTLRPRVRLGLAYQNNNLQLGMDVDLNENPNFHTLVQQQVISLGVDYQLLQSLSLRLGYQHDIAEFGDNRVAAGLGWRVGRFATEFAYSDGDTGIGAALQLSFYH